MYLSSYGNTAKHASLNKFGYVPFYIFQKSLDNIAFISSLNVWHEIPIKSSGSEFFYGKIFNNKFNYTFTFLTD